MPGPAGFLRLTDSNTAESLSETKGCIVSENQVPPSGDESPLTPPPPPPPATPAAAPALAASPVPPGPQPTQSYPGAPPTYAPPAQPAYGLPPAAAPQLGYAPPPAHPGYGTPPAPYGTPPAQSGYAPYAAPGYPSMTPRPMSGLAITALVCGIAGIVLFWAIIPVLASITAVITGHMALGQTKRDPTVGGRGMAIAGLILGYLVVAVGAFVLVSTIISFLFVGAFSLPYLFSS